MRKITAAETVESTLKTQAGQTDYRISEEDKKFINSLFDRIKLVRTGWVASLTYESEPEKFVSRYKRELIKELIKNNVRNVEAVLAGIEKLKKITIENGDRYLPSAFEFAALCKDDLAPYHKPALIERLPSDKEHGLSEIKKLKLKRGA